MIASVEEIKKGASIKLNLGFEVLIDGCVID